MFKFLKKNNDGTIEDYFIDYVASKVALTDLALEIGANKIADVVSKLGFRVLTRNLEEEKEGDYIFNVKPNVNQNATDFWKQVVYRMIKEPEGCLVINLREKGLFIADNWETDNSVIAEKIYKNITLIVDDDTLKLNRTFKASDVMHFRYSNPKLINLLKSNNDLVDKAWSVALNGLKAKAPKLKLAIPAGLTLKTKDGRIVTSNEYADELAQNLSSDEIKAIVSNSNMDISVIDTKTSLTTADLKSLREEVYSNTAIALGIPKNVFYGEVTSNADANDAFITYACEPIIEIIDDTVAGSYFEKKEYMEGDRIIVNTLSVKHIDVISSAGNLDKLYQNGWCHNDILELLGQPIIDEAWAWERRFTKNYSSNLEGGESNEA